MAFVCWATALPAAWCWGEWCDITTEDWGTLGGGGAATAGGIDWWAVICGKVRPGECCDCDDTVGPVCEVTDEGEVGGEAIKWLGECKSGDPICMGGLTCMGGGLGTAVILANNDWNDVEGEYMEAIPGGSIWGGALRKINKIIIIIF